MDWKLWKGLRELRKSKRGCQLPDEYDELADAVISTGGSVVYSEGAMARLAATGPVVYLCADLPTLTSRVAAAPPAEAGFGSCNRG